MEENAKDVRLRITGRHIDGDKQKETVEVFADGKMYRKDEYIYIIYEEYDDAFLGNVRTRMKIGQDDVKMTKVILRNNSEEKMEMLFKASKRHRGEYPTPMGNLKVEVLTRKVENNILEEEGFVQVDYDISIIGLRETRAQLEVKII